MTYNALAVVHVGDAPDVLHPSIDENLQIVPEPLDGPFGQPFQVSMASVRRKVGNSWVSQLKTKDISFQFWITGSRVVLYCRNFDKGGGWVGFGLGGLAVAVTANAISKGMAANRRKGKALVGNIRYPWITKVGFAPRNGYGTRETIDIEYVDGTDPTKPECSLTIHLDNRTDANLVARHIVEKIIAYRYADQDDMAEDELAKFEALRTSGPKGPPQKGYVNFYIIPTSWKVPNGLSKAPDAVPAFPPTAPKRVAGAVTPALAPPPAPPEPIAPSEQPQMPIATVIEPGRCASCGSEHLGVAYCTECGAAIAAA